MKIPVTRGRQYDRSHYFRLFAFVHCRKMNEVNQAIQAQLLRHPPSGNLGGTSNSNYCRLMLRSVEFGAAAERRTRR